MFIVLFDYFLFNLVSTSAGELRVYCVFDYFLFNLVSTSAGELRKSAFLLCVWLFSLQSCLHFSRWVMWKCMFIVCLTISLPLQVVSYVKVHVYCVFDVKVHVYCVFDCFLSPLQRVSYMKVHVYCVFDYFLFNLVSISAGELRESACLLFVWLFFLQSCLQFSRWVMWKCMFIVCLTIFSWIFSTLGCELHKSACLLCVWLFSLSTLGGELREIACLLCIWLFSLQSCLHFSWWVTWKCMFIVCLTIFSSILSPLHDQVVSYVKVNVYFVFDYLIHFRRWVMWKLVVCLTIFSSILSLLQSVSYVKVQHVYCVFDYFLFNLVSTSAGELCKSAC